MRKLNVTTSLLDSEIKYEGGVKTHALRLTPQRP